MTLLAEVAETAPTPQHDQIRSLAKTIMAALPQLLTFADHVDQVHADLAAVLPPDQHALLGWAWLRRNTLGWTSADIVAAGTSGVADGRAHPATHLG